VIMATILLLKRDAWEHNWIAVSFGFSGCSSLYQISIMGVLYCYYLSSSSLGKPGRGLVATLGCAYHCTGPKEGEGNRGLVVDEIPRTIVQLIGE